MIKGLQGSAHIVVHDNSYTTLHVDMNKPLAGQVRWNGQTRTLEVFDGYHYNAITNDRPVISLDPTSAKALDWVIDKMNQEKRILVMAQSNPAVKAAWENFKRAEEQLQTTIILSQDETTTS